MILNCKQVEMLLSFYIDGDLNSDLRKKIKEHLNFCEACKNKHDMLLNFYDDMEKSYQNLSGIYPESFKQTQEQYRFFKTNLSAYLDNELPLNETVKLKKYTINNQKAKNELEQSYRLKELLKECFDKTKSRIKQDFSEKVIAEINTSKKLNRIDFYLKTMAAIILICVGAITLITIMICI